MVYEKSKSKKDSDSEDSEKSEKERIAQYRKNIDSAYINFKDNNDRFHLFQEFAFRSAITNEEQDALRAVMRPIIEFNLVNAPLSRLCGEFSKQEPSIFVGARNGAQVDPAQIEVVEGIIRNILYEAQKHNAQYNVYRDALSGGFSCWKVYTEYESEMSMDQVIRLARCYEPTFVFFDPNAREVTKSDAEWYAEICPIPIPEFKAKNPGVDIEMLKTNRGDNFQWYYSIGGEDVIVECHYYKKKRTKKTIIKLSNGDVIPEEDYKEYVEKWESSGKIEVPPVKVGKSRETIISNFCCYRMTGCNILEETETSFKEPNYIFVDGDSVVLKNGTATYLRQFTKPYIYHARGLQKLINVAGQTITNDIETMTMHKFMIAEEALPSSEEDLEALRNPQIASVLVSKAYMEVDGQQVQLPPISSVQRVGLPPDVMNTFNSGLQLLQNILGTTDMQLGVQNNQLSGIAIVEAASQSNATAMPYIVNNMQGLNQAGQVIAQIIPEYMATARTIPIIDKEGNRQVIKVNQDGHVSLTYDPNSIEVKIEAGVNFAIAKDRALKQLIAIMQVSPMFEQFMTQRGLPIFLDNVEFQGVDIVKEEAKKWMAEMEQQQAQQGQQPSPEQVKLQIAQGDQQLKAQELQQQAEKDQANIMIEKQKLAAQFVTDKENTQVKKLQALADIQEADDQLQIAYVNAEAEQQRTEAEAQLAIAQEMRASQDQEHSHLIDILKMSQDANIAKEKTVTDRMKKTESNPKPTKAKGAKK